MTIAREELHVLLPKNLVDKLRHLVPANERDAFMAQALAHELRRRQMLQIFDHAAGAWHAEDHQDLATFDDVNAWLEEHRRAQRDFSSDPNERPYFA